MDVPGHSQVSFPLPLALLMFPCLLPTGLIGNIYLNNSPLKNFRIYSLDMKESFFQRWVPTGQYVNS